MAKAVHGEYGAFTTKNSVRYQYRNKLISDKAIPPEVVALLNKQLGYTPKEETAKFPRPSEEELARMRVESNEVPAHLLKDEPPLAPEDFEEPADPETPVSDATGTPLPRSDEPDNRSERHKREEIESVLLTPERAKPELTSQEQVAHSPLQPTVDPDFLESVSIHTASIDDMAIALYNRFGLYTVYLNQLPEADEVNPLTGEQFTKYDLGVAYQAGIRAMNKGVPRPEVGRKTIDEGRAASANFKEAFVPAPTTMGEARRADSFEFRTSPQGTRTIPTTEVVHETGADGKIHAVQQDIPEGETGQFNGATAVYDAEEEEPLVQPNFSGKPVIRPNW